MSQPAASTAPSPGPREARGPDLGRVRAWLGLRPDCPWPPDPRTLLGLSSGDADAAQIESKAEERIARVRPYQLQYPEEVTEAMNRLTQALLALTGAREERQGDRETRRQGDERRTSSPPLSSRSRPKPAPAEELAWLRVVCRGCGAAFRVPMALAGPEFRCPRCRPAPSAAPSDRPLEEEDGLDEVPANRIARRHSSAAALGAGVVFAALALIGVLVMLRFVRSGANVERPQQKESASISLADNATPEPSDSRPKPDRADPLAEAERRLARKDVDGAKSLLRTVEDDVRAVRADRIRASDLLGEIDRVTSPERAREFLRGLDDAELEALDRGGSVSGVRPVRSPALREVFGNNLRTFLAEERERRSRERIEAELEKQKLVREQNRYRQARREIDAALREDAELWDEFTRIRDGLKRAGGEVRRQLLLDDGADPFAARPKTFEGQQILDDFKRRWKQTMTRFLAIKERFKSVHDRATELAAEKGRFAAVWAKLAERAERQEDVVELTRADLQGLRPAAEIRAEMQPLLAALAQTRDAPAEELKRAVRPEWEQANLTPAGPLP